MINVHIVFVYQHQSQRTLVSYESEVFWITTTSVALLLIECCRQQVVELFYMSVVISTAHMN